MPKTPIKKQEQMARRLRDGMPVTVIRDDSTLFDTRVIGDPWLMGGHSWMVKVDGIAGGYSVTRVMTR